MAISKTCNHPSFGMKFSEKQLNEVVDYAKNTNQLRKLDTALNNLLHVNKGDVLIVHGKNPEGKVYSSFVLGRKSIQNLGADSPAEASFNGIIELGELGRKFRRLIGGEVKENLKAEDFKRYTI